MQSLFVHANLRHRSLATGGRTIDNLDESGSMAASKHFDAGSLRYPASEEQFNGVGAARLVRNLVEATKFIRALEDQDGGSAVLAAKHLGVDFARVCNAKAAVDAAIAVIDRRRLRLWDTRAFIRSDGFQSRICRYRVTPGRGFDLDQVSCPEVRCPSDHPRQIGPTTNPNSVFRKVSSLGIKNIPLSIIPKSVAYAGPFRFVKRGRIARSSRTSGRNAMDAAMPRFLARRRQSCVRRSRVVLAPRPWRLSTPARAGSATVTINAAHRGEHEGNRQTIARGKPV